MAATFNRPARRRFGNDFGLELRVLHGGELIESRLSRVGEAPLLLIADQLKVNLIAQGWIDNPSSDWRMT